ncbi:DUF1156 domain-containing protein [bacterium]|nr:DUF1156 domain-containing protein [bacterium]
MIPKECKRLAEVDFPIAVVSKHSVREKSIRHGHPSTLHLWWARRPLAACRAMLMALLLPDPCDPLCPNEFKSNASKIIEGMYGISDDNMGLRKNLLTFIGDFANWDVANDPHWIGVARELVKAAHPEETPLVVDPFAGGGSIPLEALRLGCDTFASDINPVACLILKVLLEDIPRHGTELSNELRNIGAEIKDKAEKELNGFYPKDKDGAVPIAYLWARTVRCEAPNCGAEIPLIRSFWLCKKANYRRALRPIIKSSQCDKKIEFEIFEPENEEMVQKSTVVRAKATCLCCGAVLPPKRVRIQLSAQMGGADVIFDENGQRTGGAKMLAVVTMSSGIQGRHYRLPNSNDLQAVFLSQGRYKKIIEEWQKDGKKELCPIPDELIPNTEIRRISVPLYGCRTWGSLFSKRQAISLFLLASLTRAKYSISSSMSIAVHHLLMLSVSKQAERLSSLVSWITQTSAPRGSFARQALGIVWDFCELVPIVLDQEYSQLLNSMCLVIERIHDIKNIGQIQQISATKPLLPEKSAPIIFTDPPYYDSVPYAHLSDFFYVWLRRSTELQGSQEFANYLVSKDDECVVDRPHSLSTSNKNNEYFEKSMADAMAASRSLLLEEGIGSVVFAHKTTEGWEALLSGMLEAGITITASWPIQTERGVRLNAQDQAALATSVHLVCRPRPDDAQIGDWSGVLRELPIRVGNWMGFLQEERIRGADLVFACIGPALEIFSRYRRVETADGREVKLAEYLEKVWEIVGRMALEQILGTDEARARNGIAGVLEEDARLTALFLWTLQSTNGQNGIDTNTKRDEETVVETEIDDEEEEAPKGKTKGYSLIYDVVRRFAQPLGIALPNWEDRIIETKKGIVRLMSVSERATQIFGTSGLESTVEELLAPTSSGQMVLPGFEEIAAKKRMKTKGRRKTIIMDDPGEINRSATTLDRVHAAMLLQGSGQANALRMLIKTEQGRGPDFLRLANALSALYPKGSEEKRLVDAMLLAVPR